MFSVLSSLCAAEEAAPALKVSGSFKSGLRVQSADGGHLADLYSDHVSMDWGNHKGHAYRLDINGVYDTGPWGLQVGVRQEYQKQDSAHSLSFREIFGYLNLLDKRINIKLGLIDSSVWSTQGLQDVVLANGTGLRVETRPVEGLLVGAFFGATGNLETLEGESLSAFFSTVTLGASYTNPNFYAVAAYRPKGLPKGTNNPFVDEDGLVSNQFVAGFGITGVDKLKITGEFLFTDGFHKAGRNSNYHWEINQDLTYQYSVVTMGLEFFQRPNGSGGIENDFEAELGPKVRYALNDRMTLGLDLPFTVIPDMALKVKPSYTWNLGGSSSVLIFDELEILPQVKNTLQFDIVFRF
jgi:hypothetical protein